MFKLRVGPSAQQLRRWDTANLVDPAIADTLRYTHPWTGGDGRLEIVNRIRLSRILTGDVTFDIDHWLTRIEGPPPSP